MEKVCVEFTKTEANNILAFLGTVTLTGKEVPAFVDILNKITDGLEEVNKVDD